MRSAALGLLFLPWMLSVAGVVLLILGHGTLGLACLVAGVILRVLLYVIARLNERSANRSAKPS